MSTNANTSTNGHHDAHDLIERAKKFSLRLPVVGTVQVPPPDQMAFYGALGLLAALNVIDWPVALAVGAGQVVVARHFRDRNDEEHEKPAAKPAARKKAPTKATR